MANKEKVDKKPKTKTQDNYDVKMFWDLSTKTMRINSDNLVNQNNVNFLVNGDTIKLDFNAQGDAFLEFEESRPPVTYNVKMETPGVLKDQRFIVWV